MSEPGTSAGFDVRLARRSEYDAIGELTVRGYAHDGLLKPEDHYASVLRDAADRAKQAELWVAAGMGSGRLLGSVTYCPRGSPYRELARETEGEFRMLAVDPDVRRGGVGRALVQQCLDLSRRAGDEAVVLCSLPAMTKAHALYRSFGFERAADLDWSPVEGVDLLGFRLRL